MVTVLVVNVLVVTVSSGSAVEVVGSKSVFVVVPVVVVVTGVVYVSVDEEETVVSVALVVVVNVVVLNASSAQIAQILFALPCPPHFHPSSPSGPLKENMYGGSSASQPPEMMCSPSSHNRDTQSPPVATLMRGRTCFVQKAHTLNDACSSPSHFHML